VKGIIKFEARAFFGTRLQIIINLKVRELFHVSSAAADRFTFPNNQ
jgi:hypothetical protein